MGSGTEAGRVYLTNGKHDDESNSSDFLTDFLQQSNQGKDKSRLLSFTQHFSLCQEFFICHKNIIHMLHRLWTIFSKPSAMYPAAPKLSVIWAGQQMANTPSALPLECPRVWRRGPHAALVHKGEKPNAAGNGAPWTDRSFAEILEKLGAVTQSECSEKLLLMVILSIWLV